LLDPDILLASKQGRRWNVKSLEVLHLFVAFLFYAFVAVALVLLFIRWTRFGRVE